MVYKRLFNPIKPYLTFSLLILHLILFLSVPVHAGQDNIPKGVAKSGMLPAKSLFSFYSNSSRIELSPNSTIFKEAHLYGKKGSTWECLDGSATIQYEAINDDYCDCADGSDEPGEEFIMQLTF
jgi:hypothetical protein